MNRVFTDQGWEDYLHWTQQDRKTLRKVNELIKECCRTPHGGTGHPEPLRGDYSGWWSRRIDEKNRLVYRIEEDRIIIMQCRSHYDDR